MSYAEKTTVPISRSRDEIERTLKRFDAGAQGWVRDDERGIVTVAFKRKGRAYKFTIAIPPLEYFRLTASGKLKRTDKQTEDAHDQEVRRRFRSLANYIKAVLDAVDTGIITAEEALLPFMVLASGETVFERAAAQIGKGQDIHFGLMIGQGKG